VATRWRALVGKKLKTQQGQVPWQGCKMQFACYLERVAFKPASGLHGARSAFKPTGGGGWIFGILNEDNRIIFIRRHNGITPISNRSKPTSSPHYPLSLFK